MQLGYLGPRGTFSELAALTFRDAHTLTPFHTIYDVAKHVAQGTVDFGIIPVENSTEGMVNITLDSIIFDFDLFIQKKLILPITQNLMVRSDFSDEPIAKILSHPQALAQCASFLHENYPDAELIQTNSTAEAARLVSESSENFAAIGPTNCAEIYCLRLLHKQIQDNDDNTTQFIVVTKQDTTKIVSGCTMSIAFSTLNKPGELYKMLDIFSIWDINMTKIVSRPMRKKTGEYVFFVDLEVSDEDDFKDALKMMKRKASFFKLLGCYETLRSCVTQ